MRRPILLRGWNDASPAPAMASSSRIAIVMRSDARLEMPECDEFWTLPLDSGTSVLEVGARFSDLTSAPRADGSSIDLSRLPPTDEVDEIILVAGPKTPRISLINESEDYRATIEWDSAFLKNALLWISNRGRKGAPWGGENLCLGIEPITSPSTSERECPLRPIRSPPPDMIPLST